MVDIKAFPYLCFVRFDLVHKEFDRQFNIHFDDHIQELADRPGYSTAWRTRELRGGPHNDSDGVMEQETLYLTSLEAATSYTIQGDELRLGPSASQVTLVFASR